MTCKIVNHYIWDMQHSKEAFTFLTTLIEEIPFGVITITNDGRVTLINSKALKFLGLEDNANLYEDIPIHTFISNTKLRNKLTSCLLENEGDFNLRALNIRNKFLTISGKRMSDGMIINIVDVTKTVLMRDQATKSLIFGQETERRRLAKEIHDGIGPHLSTIRLHVEAISRKINDEVMKAKLKDVNEQLSEVATEIRQISHALMPSSLIDFGIVTVLENMVKRLNDTDGVEVNFDCNLKDGELPKELELNLFRIIQELVNNALKYAECKEIQIQLNRLDDQLRLTVYDDGIGIDSSQVHKGNGINNVSTRVRSYRGSFELESNPGQGVNALITIPLKRRKS